MLYNPKWQQQNDKTFQGVSLLALIAWLETQSPAIKYYFEDPITCLAARFLQGTTGCDRYESLVDFGFNFEKMGPERGRWLYDIVQPAPRTYGAALERAYATLAGDT